MKLLVFTFFSFTWRFCCFISDWRTLLRLLTGRPIIDVAFITNMREEVDRQRFLGCWKPSSGHFNGPRYHIMGIIGQTRSINSTAANLSKPHGRKIAKEQALNAIRWAKKRGAKTILLAASTKRLFGKDGSELKRLSEFDDLVFTIGDNGTMFLLLAETLQALRECGLNPKNSRIAVLGPYGFLGELMTRKLVEEGYNVVGAGSNVFELKRMANQYGIETATDYSKLGKVDAVIACTHSDDIKLNSDNVNLIRRNNKKLLVLDVAEPQNLTEDQYELCKDSVIRQDAGNGYSPNLEYVLGWITYSMFRLTKGVTFGCFAEALSLTAARKRGEDIGSVNWFTVEEAKMKIIFGYFQKIGFTIPSPRCFGHAIESYNLDLCPNQTVEPSRKIAAK